MIVEDRFFEPDTIPFDELIRADYQMYLESLQEDEEPLTFKRYKEIYS